MSHLKYTVAQLDSRPTGDQKVAGSTPAGSATFFRGDLSFTVILSLPLIQEGQLPVSGERMCTILVNHLDDRACPVKVLLSKLTALYMNHFGRKNLNTNKISNIQIFNTFEVKLKYSTIAILHQRLWDIYILISTISLLHWVDALVLLRAIYCIPETA